jgi:hypothetical protein
MKDSITNFQFLVLQIIVEKFQLHSYKKGDETPIFT